jgi:mono/diheme cytochrome c family protein
MLIGLAGSIAALAQTKIKEVPARNIDSLEGKDLFNQFCAVCHGVDGRGKGPAAEALKRPPTDLTQLAIRNKGKYPDVAVKISIRNPKGVIEHGTGEMPMWGPIFSQSGQQPHLAEMRVHALVDYIKTMQQ